MPYVQNLIVDRRVGARDLGTTVPCTDVEVALKAIRALDGAARTQVILEGPERSFLVGGGNDGRFNVIVTVNVDEEFFNLVNPSGSEDKEVMIVTGGQAGPFPERLCVNLASVLKAAEVFFETGQTTSELTWDRS